jgi:hypothetical protein
VLDDPDEFDLLLADIEKIIGERGTNLDIQTKGRIISKLNEFLFQSYDGIGTTKALDDDEFEYFSNFHKFWEKHHQEILGVAKAEPQLFQDVASVLDKIHQRQGDSIFELPINIRNIPREQIVEARFFTANQDFRESIPLKIYDKIVSHPDRFDRHRVASAPEEFISFIGVTGLSQTEKRVSFAKKAAEFLLKKNISAFQLAEQNDNNAEKIRNMLESNSGIGYKRKKADMFIRDMYVLGVWPDLTNIDVIDVASDRNTMRVALRLGIVKSRIPLVSSFLDIFSYQYGLMDAMSAEAWRAVWNEWRSSFPQTCPKSPAMMDYMIYRMGQTCFNGPVYEYRCTRHANHIFYRSTRQTKKCETCREKAVPQQGVPAIQADIGKVEVPNCSLIQKCQGKCVFHDLISQDIERSRLEPPKSISILGRTGWESARTTKEQGAGGPMG